MMLINQDPKFGVQKKFSKTIRSHLLRFDEEMLNYFIEWYEYLKTEKLFGNADPIFPRNKISSAENSFAFESKEVEPKFWQSATSIRDIFKQRFEFAEIEYFSPHTFRHLAILTALSKCKNGQEIKAISQNFGHENVSTTLTTYGTLNQTQMNDIITGMSFNKEATSDNQIMQKLKALIAQENQSKF